MSINEEIRNAIEHYACRSSTKCVKLEDFRQLIGGSYTWNTCIDFTMASNIFKIFCNFSLPYIKVRWGMEAITLLGEKILPNIQR